jgi:hypothetical protein
MPRWIAIRLSYIQAVCEPNAIWDAAKKSLDVAQNGVNLTPFGGIKAL